ncbi:RagB/SusD family nutrient uptake outer membrane protein [Rufibacter immobilis]|uniref:RagB/SusD family nutrient uptake outer membrane protein n=1 Tax=Rufibacter immobilis TaxID=1348778 RepID=UPI0035ECBF9F
MKKFLYTLSLMACASLFQACDNLLEEEPQYTLNEQTLFTDSKSAQLALNACYGYLAAHGVYGQSLISVSDIGSGLGRENKNGDNLNSLGTAMTASGGGGEVFRLWNGLYKTISECNIFINAVNRSSLENKDYLLGQAKFIRALSYYNLAFLFGGVPLKLTPPTPETTDVPRSTKAEVVNQVIKDLVEAEASLKPAELEASVPSKITVNAMLAKVYFLLGSAEGAGSSHWKTAQNYGNKVFAAMGEVPLEESFAKLFNENTRTSKEAIFLLNYSTQGVNQSWNKNSWMYSPQNSTVNGINFGTRSASRAFYTYYTTSHPNDPRIDATFFHKSYQRMKPTVATVNLYPLVKAFNVTGYPLIKKHFDSQQQGQVSGKMFIVYRYADFLLLMADVENELGNTGAAVKYVNRVLARARGSVSPAASSPIDVPANISQIDLRQFIFDERHFELFGEGHSFMDARRRGTEFLSQITKRHNLQADAISGFTTATAFTEYRLPEAGAALEKAMLMPIPTQEISTNKAIEQEDQNPGY